MIQIPQVIIQAAKNTVLFIIDYTTVMRRNKEATPTISKYPEYLKDRLPVVSFDSITVELLAVSTESFTVESINYN